MANKHGEFIWYELMTEHPEAAQSFYEKVVGWKLVPHQAGDVNYPTIAAGDAYVGGFLTLTEDMCQHGARPTWIGYVGVDDVDSTAAKVEELGGAVLMPARDIPGVGRVAMVTDSENIPFYIMHGASNDSSTAFSQEAVGHCCWNELMTLDQDITLAFYGPLLNWESNGGMPISDGVEYKFLQLDGSRFGALSPCTDPKQTPGWTFYFRVPDIQKAAEKIVQNKGVILFGPDEVPGGDYIVIGRDPEGVVFGLAGKSVA